MEEDISLLMYISFPKLPSLLALLFPCAFYPKLGSFAAAKKLRLPRLSRYPELLLFL